MGDSETELFLSYLNILFVPVIHLIEDIRNSRADKGPPDARGGFTSLLQRNTM